MYLILNKNGAKTHIASDFRIQDAGKIFRPHDPKFEANFFFFNFKENLSIYKKSLIYYRRSFFLKQNPAIIYNLSESHIKIIWKSFGRKILN